MWSSLSVCIAGGTGGCCCSDINIITRGQIVEKIVWPFLMFLDLRFIQTLAPGTCLQSCDLDFKNIHAVANNLSFLISLKAKQLLDIE